jgi:hypothetical protein
MMPTMTAHVPPFLRGSSRVVTHACPECPIGAPRVFCECCGGHGNVTDGQLARWQLKVLSDVPLELRG